MWLDRLQVISNKTSSPLILSLFLPLYLSLLQISAFTHLTHSPPSLWHVFSSSLSAVFNAGPDLKKIVYLEETNGGALVGTKCRLLAAGTKGPAYSGVLGARGVVNDRKVVLGETAEDGDDGCLCLRF